MQRTLMTLFLSQVIVIQSSYAQWIIEQNVPLTNFQEITFVDNLHGYVSGNGIVSTTDGGKTWIQAKFEDNSTLTSLSVKNRFLWASTDLGKVYWSQDSAKTLNLKYSDKVAYDFYSISFVDSLRGWLFGSAFGTSPSGEIILHTTDGGTTWKPQYELDQPPSTPGHLYKGFFVDSLHGWAARQYYMLHTFNGGNDWIGQSVPGAPDLYSVFFVDTSRGWAVGDDGIRSYVIFTMDGGQNWVQGNTTIASTVRSVFFVDSSSGWISCGDGTIAHSTDGGQNWTIQQSNTNGSLESLFFVNKQNGWAVGGYGIILHTTNGGVTAVPPANEKPVAFSISHNFPNPFNPTTKIRYAIPVQGDVNLSVFDLLGNRISVLQNGPQGQGEFETVFDAKGLSSGIYIYRITYYHNGLTEVSNQKMLVLK